MSRVSKQVAFLQKKSEWVNAERVVLTISRNRGHGGQYKLSTPQDIPDCEDAGSRSHITLVLSDRRLIGNIKLKYLVTWDINYVRKIWQIKAT